MEDFIFAASLGAMAFLSPFFLLFPCCEINVSQMQAVGFRRRRALKGCITQLWSSQFYSYTVCSQSVVVFSTKVCSFSSCYLKCTTTCYVLDADMFITDHWFRRSLSLRTVLLLGGYTAAVAAGPSCPWNMWKVIQKSFNFWWQSFVCVGFHNNRAVVMSLRNINRYPAGYWI